MFHCDCGNDKPIPVGHVGKSVHSCGHCGVLIFDREDCKTNSKYNGLHNTWAGMKQRCNNPNSQAYCSYGSRGIKICDEWNDSYSTFKKWALENNYNPSLGKEQQSIDRINVNGNYAPDNCRWVDNIVQARNKTNNVWIDFYGEKILLLTLAKRYDLPYELVYQRHYRCHKQGDDLVAPARKLKKYSIHNEMLTVDEIVNKYKVTRSAALNRIYRKTLDKLQKVGN